MTRRQEHLKRAMRDVGAVNRLGDEVQGSYGGLCHKLPILIRTNGLCQTLAFVEEKARGDDARAQGYDLLRRHMAGTLGYVDGNDQPLPNRLLPAVRDASLDDYLRQTRTLLEAAVYYKRMAVAILGIESPDAGGE